MVSLHNGQLWQPWLDFNQQLPMARQLGCYAWVLAKAERFASPMGCRKHRGAGVWTDLTKLHGAEVSWQFDDCK